MMSTTLVDYFVTVCYKGVSNAYATGEYLIYGSHPLIYNKIKELDLQLKISNIRSICNENTLTISKFGSLNNLRSEILKTCNTIDNIFLQIQTQIEIYEHSFFKYWKTPDCQELFLLLDAEARILDNRYTDFIKILHLYVLKDNTKFLLEHGEN